MGHTYRAISRGKVRGVRSLPGVGGRETFVSKRNWQTPAAIRALPKFAVLGRRSKKRNAKEDKDEEEKEEEIEEEEEGERKGEEGEGEKEEGGAEEDEEEEKSE